MPDLSPCVRTVDGAVYELPTQTHHYFQDMTVTQISDHRYRPRGVQRDLLHIHDPEVLLSGPAGPVKENDHGCDVMRYVVAARDLRGVPNVRWA